MPPLSAVLPFVLASVLLPSFVRLFLVFLPSITAPLLLFWWLLAVTLLLSLLILLLLGCDLLVPVLHLGEGEGEGGPAGRYIYATALRLI